jgi:type IV pilus assembly protein PilB
VFEVMEVNSAIREAIYDDSPTYKIAEVACSQGMITLEDAGRRLVMDGVTSVEELRRLLSDTQLTQR